MIYKTEVLILDCPEIRCYKVLKIVFKEFCGAFERKNVPVRVINNIKDIHDDAIVLLGDDFQVPNPGKLLADVSVKAVYIGWYWHQHDTSMLPLFLHIHENMLANKTMSPDKVEVMRFMHQVPNSCPLLLRANESPRVIGSYSRQILYDFCFMGGWMCDSLVPIHRYNGYYFGSHEPDDYVPYEERRKVYLSSVFALGFQTDDNIRNGHVSQRIFEAMAYGCVVLSHSLHACIQTNGIVEYVEPCPEKYAERMDFFIQNQDYILKKQQQGYEFVRKWGTNDYALSLILAKLSF